MIIQEETNTKANIKNNIIFLRIVIVIWESLLIVNDFKNLVVYILRESKRINLIVLSVISIQR